MSGDPIDHIDLLGLKEDSKCCKAKDNPFKELLKTAAETLGDEMKDLPPSKVKSAALMVI